MVASLGALNRTITALCHAVKSGVLPTNWYLLIHILSCIEERAGELADDLDAVLPDLLFAHKKPHRRRYLCGLLAKLEASILELHDRLTDDQRQEEDTRYFATLPLFLSTRTGLSRSSVRKNWARFSRDG